MNAPCLICGKPHGAHFDHKECSKQLQSQPRKKTYPAKNRELSKLADFVVKRDL